MQPKQAERAIERGHCIVVKTPSGDVFSPVLVGKDRWNVFTVKGGTFDRGDMELLCDACPVLVGNHATLWQKGSRWTTTINGELPTGGFTSSLQRAMRVFRVTEYEHTPPKTIAAARLQCQHYAVFPHPFDIAT